MRFVKGHGTENDFVILPDPDGSIELTPGLVAALCDRRAGIGADGLLRVVRTKALGRDDDAEWFMDYHNADGSIAEMCGNGARVFARYLVEAGLAAPGDLPIGTRGGVRAVRLDATGDVTVDMDARTSAARARPSWTASRARASRSSPETRTWPARSPLPSPGDLGRAPLVDAADFPDGVNVELFRPVGDGRVEMRVYERGSGETRSCGTGAVATAVAAAHAEGRTQGTWEIAVPGGVVSVILDGTTSFLRGPAVLVAEGEIRPEFFRA